MAAKFRTTDGLKATVQKLPALINDIRFAAISGDRAALQAAIANIRQCLMDIDEQAK